MGPTWGQSGSCRPQMGPMLVPWILLSRVYLNKTVDIVYMMLSHRDLVTSYGHVQCFFKYKGPLALSGWRKAMPWFVLFRLALFCRIKTTSILYMLLTDTACNWTAQRYKGIRCAYSLWNDCSCLLKSYYLWKIGGNHDNVNEAKQCKTRRGGT